MCRSDSPSHIRLGRWSTAGKGFTLIEMMATLAVLGILLALAAPSFTTFFEKFRTKRAAETLAGNLIQAKTEAIKRNKVVSLVITTSNSGATWCYGLVEGSVCDCTTAGSCVLDGVATTVSSANYKDISLVDGGGNVIASLAFSFNPIRGTVGGNTAAFVSANGYEARTVVSGFGRIKTCSPSSNYIGGGYTEC